jgi:DUF971 family protein
MSQFWDTLKPAKKSPVPVAVDAAPDQLALSLRWDDGHQSTLTARALRQRCPCAECVEEWTGKRTFTPDAIPEGLKLVSVNPVGNYALGMTFGDGHSTGIFNWALLHELSEKLKT